MDWNGSHEACYGFPFLYKMTFTEKDLETIIMQADPVEISTRGLNIRGKRYSQLRLGNYGIADIVTFHKQNKGRKVSLGITIYELKKENVNVKTLAQTMRYVTGITRYIHEHRQKDIPLTFKIVLIGKQVDDGDWLYILNDLNIDFEIFQYEYKIYGLFFSSYVSNPAGVYLKREFKLKVKLENEQ